VTSTVTNHSTEVARSPFLERHIKEQLTQITPQKLQGPRFLNVS
jgi:hypothetical protein